MIIELVDPRDVQHEVDQPVYRVYFWNRPAPPSGVPTQDLAYPCEEYRLQGALDVHEVVRWATATAVPEQTFVIYAEHHIDGRPELIRLAGRDPNQSGRP
jgi:hypothetical protein